VPAAALAGRRGCPAESGFTVVCAGRRSAPLEVVVAEAGDGAVVLADDVRSPESVSSMFAEVAARFGRLDLLVNNAGIGASAVPLEDVGLEHWLDVVHTNLTGAFLCTQEAFRIMKRQSPSGERVINNGSLSASVPTPRRTPPPNTRSAA
jgi:NAD(P)-dependent dehydrogenase (short-subunit alcohol dehydrogenase family)